MINSIILNDDVNKIIKNTDYEQWLTDLVLRILKKSIKRLNKLNINIEKMEIVDLDEKRIYLQINDKFEGIIRTWNFQSIHKDKNGETDKEKVDCSFYIFINDDGSSTNIIDNIDFIIKWKNQ